MERIEPRTLSGFMELLPNEQILFNQMKEKIQKTYEKFGFLPLDTPIIESAEVLLAKAGGETEKQIYRFQKGDSDLALRFDLTVPLAKYVAKNYGSLSFPFRRYQIGKVYRGERAQKGRYREFYQCDIDIIGDGELDLINDAEIPSIIYTLFRELGFEDFTIKINNRKILNGLFEGVNQKENATEILRIIDKIEKIGKEAVIEELRKLDVKEEQINSIMNFIEIEGTSDEKLEKLEKLGIANETYKKGVEELKTVIKNVRLFGVPEANFKVDLTIARGLDYYTGTVYETFLNDYRELGSVCSGGRYENLAEYYTDKSLPGVGISIGLTRLFYKLNELNIIKAEKKSISDILIIPITEKLEEAFAENEEWLAVLSEAVYQYQKKTVRKMILKDHKRPDGRAITQIRPLAAETDLVPRVHGSAMFTRGQTQICTITTLAPLSEAQRLDGLDEFETSKRYMHHYNFPSYSVGETKPSRGPGRREIGHGALAERALVPVLPAPEEFPYAIRTVSETFESNGSTSQASICASTMSLMSAGVPIKKPVAGISCGLVTGETDDDYIVLTDIQGLEDFFGDMDFKVAGTHDGITAIQMDIKIHGLTRPIIEEAIAKTKEAREYILTEVMEKCIAEPRKEVSKYAPKIVQIQIDPDKIGDVVGQRGKTDY